MTLETRLPLANGKPSSGHVMLKQLMHPRTLFVGTGAAMLTMLCLVPIWTSISLMTDANYIFWFGKSTPMILICMCIGIVILYVGAITSFFKHAPESAQNDQSVMMIASIFVTLLGLLLMLVALPLTHETTKTYTNLMNHCDSSEQTHRVYEYSQVLQNIRQKPSCLEKESVVQCEGYEDAYPYTNFLKYMEEEFRCSGFCYRKTVAAAESTNQTSFTRYPPTLFSSANYKSTCDGMAARDIMNCAGDMGYQLFYQGIYFVLISIVMGFLKIIGFCTKKPQAQAEMNLMYGEGSRL